MTKYVTREPMYECRDCGQYFSDREGPKCSPTGGLRETHIGCPRCLYQNQTMRVIQRRHCIDPNVVNLIQWNSNSASAV